jgi:nucleolar protein 8
MRKRHAMGKWDPLHTQRKRNDIAEDVEDNQDKDYNEEHSVEDKGMMKKEEKETKKEEGEEENKKEKKKKKKKKKKKEEEKKR